MQAEEEKKNKQRIRESVAMKFGVITNAASIEKSGKEDEESKQDVVKARADAAKAAIAAAKSKIAARNQESNDADKRTSEPARPPVRKASRVVSLLKIRKTAQVGFGS